MVYFTKYFRQYLLGREFLIRTDHAALSWLKRLCDPIGQNARWIEQLEEFSYSIQHRAGAKHSNADSISRHPCLNKPSCTACHPDKVAECRAITSTTEQGPKLAPAGPPIAPVNRRLTAPTVIKMTNRIRFRLPISSTILLPTAACRQPRRKTRISAKSSPC